MPADMVPAWSAAPDRSPSPRGGNDERWAETPGYRGPTINPVRLGMNVPGYAGHVPGKRPQAVVGETFRRANDCAASGGEQRLPTWSAAPHRARSESPIGGLRGSGAAIPGYKGFIPRKFGENVYGKTFAAANTCAEAGADSRTSLPWSSAARNSPPGISVRAEQQPQTPLGNPDALQRAASERALPGCPETNVPGSVAGIPGYAGHIPGKMSENIHAKTFQAANASGVNRFDTIRTGQHRQDTFRSRVDRPNEPDPKRPGKQRSPQPLSDGIRIPGYKGFVPQSRAQFGTSFRVSNERALTGRPAGPDFSPQRNRSAGVEVKANAPDDNLKVRAMEREISRLQGENERLRDEASRRSSCRSSCRSSVSSTTTSDRGSRRHF